MADSLTLSKKLFQIEDLLDDAREHLALARHGPEGDAIDALTKAVQQLALVVMALKVEVVDRKNL